MFYKLIDDLPSVYMVERAPIQLWLLITLEIVVADRYGDYLLLTYPSYPLGDQLIDGCDEGYWTPPFCALPVPLSYSSPESVGAIKKEFENFEKRIDIQHELGQLTYLMGLLSPRISFKASFIELKTSPRSPDQVKCYKVLRFVVDEISMRSRRNLSDPDCLKNYAFLPLDKLSEVLIEGADKQTTYLSKPLISNLKLILSSEGFVTELKSRAIRLQDSDFFRHEEGMLLSVRLSGYSAACRYASERMHTFDQRGVEILTEFRESIASIFCDLLGKAGIFHVQMSSDGFLCAIPKRLFFGDTSQVLENFLNCYKEFTDRVEALNAYVRVEEKKMGSLLAIHYGMYRYGRIAQARSISAHLDGFTINEILRLESALSEFMMSSLSEISNYKTEQQDYSNSYNLRLSQHIVICSARIIEEAEGFFEKNDSLLLPVSGLDFGVREVDGRATVFRMNS